jgi:hypothetical protein
MVTVCCVNMLPNMGLPNLQFMFAAALAVLVKEMPRRAALVSPANKPPEVSAQPGIGASPVAANRGGPAHASPHRRNALP